MTEIVLSIILLFGLPGGPTNDFNDTAATDEAVTTSQVTSSAKRSK